MENLFLYGISGADLDGCDSFLSSLDAQANKADAEEVQGGVYIPSPQGMLNTGIDPYALPEQYDQMFVIDQNQWNYPPNEHQQGPPVVNSTSPNAPTISAGSLPSPPIKCESDDSALDDDSYQPDYPDISVESSGIAKRGSTSMPRQRKTKTSHNMIEKRYRNNINDKINILRDSVPTLREAAATTVVDGIPNIRLNKATVLTKAAEYIEQLKNRNKMLLKENSELRARVSGNRRSQFPPPVHGSASQVQARGAAGLAQDSNHQQPTAHSQSAQQAHYIPQQPPRRPMIGSNVALGCASAGLMAAGSVLSSGDSNFRGLSALPFPGLGFIGRPSTSSIKLTAVATTCFLIGCLWVSVLSKWSSDMGKVSREDVLRVHRNHRTSARENALYRLGWHRNPSQCFVALQIVLLIPQIILAAIVGPERVEAIKATFGLGSDRQAGFYLDQVIDTNLTGNRKTPTSHLIWAFMRSFLHNSPQRSMLQALQLKQLAADTSFAQFVKPIADKMWMRKTTHLPGYLQALSQVPLSDITDEALTHITITSKGIQVSDFVAVNTADPKILSTLDLFACLHAYGLQDRSLLGLLQTGSANLDQINLSARIAPPGTYANLRVKGLSALLATDEKVMNDILERITKEIPGRPVQKSFPRLMSCALTTWFARNPETAQYAETLLTERGEPLHQIHSNIVFVAYFVALKALYENGLGRSNLMHLALEVRVWLGSPESGYFGLSQRRRKELIDETIKFSKAFAANDCDEACSIPDEIVEATLLEE